MLRIHLFGPFEIWKDGLRIPDSTWSQTKTLHLLKLILLQEGRAISSDTIIEHLWPNSPYDAASQNVRSRISEIRNVIGYSSLITKRNPTSYSFNVSDNCWVDTLDFQGRLNKAHQALKEDQSAQALEWLEQALELYRGNLLSDNELESWAELPRDRYREMALDAVRTCADLYMQQNKLRQALSLIEKGIQIAASLEWLYEEAMKLHLALNQPMEALEVFNRCVASLQKLGKVPTQITEKLYQKAIESAKTSGTANDTGILPEASLKAALENALALADYDQALLHVESLIDSTTNDLGQLLLQAIDIYETRGDRKKQKVCLEQAEKLSEIRNADDFTDQVNLRYARYYTAIGSYEAAEERLQPLLQQSQSDANTQLEGETRIVFSEIFIRKGFYDEALNSLDKAEQCFRETEDELNLARVWHFRGRIGMRKWDFEDTQEHYERALTVFEKHQSKRDLALATMNLASAYNYYGKKETAIELYSEAANLLYELRDETGQSAVLYNQAITLWTLGRWEEAAAALFKVHELNPKVENWRGQRMTEQMLGIYALNIGQHDAAQKHFEAAYELAQLDDQEGEYHYWANMGILYTDLEEYPKALHCQEKALECAKDKNTRSKALAVLNLAYILTHQSEHEKARQRFRESYILIKELEAHDFEIEYHMYSTFAALKQNKPKEALQCSKRALKLIDQEYHYQHPEGVYYYHAQALEANNQSEEAQEFYLKAYEELMRRAQSFQDQDLRQSYLSNVPFNRKVMKAYQKIQSP